MNRILSVIFSLLMVTAASAQTVSGTRVIVEKKDGSKVAYAIKNVDNIRFKEVGDVSASLALAKTTDASVRVQFTPTANCKRYLIACYPASTTMTDDSLRSYIKNHYVAERTIATRYEIINLQPATDYIVASMGIDEYGIDCGVKTLAVRTADAEALQPAQVGDYFYADGTWSSELKSNKTVIGIVFSTNPTVKDKAKGWTHGQVMALRNAGTGLKWNTTGTGANENGESSYSSSSVLTAMGDRDGYTHTQTLLGKQSASVSYPAAQAAADYSDKAPATTSGWYLPAIGQAIEIANNLGHIENDSLHISSTVKGQGTWSKQGSVCVSNINAKLSTVTTADVDLLPTSGAVYLGTSSDYSQQSVYYMFVNSMAGVNSVVILGYYKDSDLYTVRPVLSF